MATGWHRRSRPFLATYRAWEGPFPAIWEAHFAKFHSYATREPMIAYGLQILGKSNSRLVICQIGVQGRGRGQTVPKFPQDLNFWHGFAQPFESQKISHVLIPLKIPIVPEFFQRSARKIKKRQRNFYSSASFYSLAQHFARKIRISQFFETFARNIKSIIVKVKISWRNEKNTKIRDTSGSLMEKQFSSVSLHSPVQTKLCPKW